MGQGQFGVQGGMTCRHGPYDSSCSSYEGNLERLKRDYREQIRKESGDATDYTIDSYEEHKSYIIMTVTYPSCKNCSFEGTKLMVFQDVTLLQVLQWKKIDPHFRADVPAAKEAPSPVARFPATVEGLKAAQTFVSAMIIPVV